MTGAEYFYGPSGRPLRKCSTEGKVGSLVSTEVKVGNHVYTTNR